MSLTEELRDDFLTCNICFEEYREPKQLPCLHTFCRQCLAKYIGGKVVETPGTDSFRCPFCRKVIHIPSSATAAQQGSELGSWADSFPNNFLLAQLSSKLKENAATSPSSSSSSSFSPYSSSSSSNCPTPNPSSSADLLHGSTADREFESTTRAKCPDHPQYPLVGYCMRQRRGVCEECCVHRHSDCIRSHVRERESRLLAEERRSECRESLGALQIKLEGLKDRIATQEMDTTARKEQLTAQTDAALGDLRTKLDLFFGQQRRELTSRLEHLVGKETNRLTTAGHQAAELSKSLQLMSDKLDALLMVAVEDNSRSSSSSSNNSNNTTNTTNGSSSSTTTSSTTTNNTSNGSSNTTINNTANSSGKRSLSVKDLMILDRARDELRKQEVAVERLRKDCFLVRSIQFHAAGAGSVDKALRDLSVGALTVEVVEESSAMTTTTKSQPGGWAVGSSGSSSSSSSRRGGEGGGGWRRVGGGGGGGARPRLHRYVSDPSTSSLQPPSTISTTDNASLPAQQRTSSPDVFDNAPPPRGPSRRGRTLSPPGAGASSSFSSSPSSEGQASGEWDAYRDHSRRRSEGHPTFTAGRRAPTAPDFGSVLIEESRRSRSQSQPRRPRPVSEGGFSSPSSSSTAAVSSTLSSSSSSAATARRRGPPLETAIDGGGPESERNSGGGERNVASSSGGNSSSRSAERKSPAGALFRGEEVQTQGGTARPERAASLATTTTNTTTTTATEQQLQQYHRISSEDDLSSLDSTTTTMTTTSSSLTFAEDAGEHHDHPDFGATNFAAAASTERESPPQAGSESVGEPGAGHSSRQIVCVRNFLASHGSDVKNYPSLVGICAVCRDRVAVSDRWNKVVKLLDISGRVMDVLVIAGGAEPWDLAMRRPGLLAVTYPKEQKIRMVDLVDGASRMHYRSHFMTRHGYASLASLDPATLIASVCPPFGTPKVHVLDYMGAVLRALDCSQLAYPRCLDVCGGDQVCVSDWTHHNVKIFALRSNNNDHTPVSSNSSPNPSSTTTTTTSTSPSPSSPSPSSSSSASSPTAVVKHTYSGVPGGPADAQLKAPMGVAWSGRGHVFIVDGKGNRLHAVCAHSGACSAIFSLPQGPGGGELKLVTFVDASPELCRSERALVVTTTTGSVQVYDLCANL